MSKECRRQGGMNGKTRARYTCTYYYIQTDKGTSSWTPISPTFICATTTLTSSEKHIILDLDLHQQISQCTNHSTHLPSQHITFALFIPTQIVIRSQINTTIKCPIQLNYKHIYPNLKMVTNLHSAFQCQYNHSIHHLGVVH